MISQARNQKIFFNQSLILSKWIRQKFLSNVIFVEIHFSEVILGWPQSTSKMLGSGIFLSQSDKMTYDMLMTYLMTKNQNNLKLIRKLKIYSSKTPTNTHIQHELKISIIPTTKIFSCDAKRRLGSLRNFISSN